MRGLILKDLFILKQNYKVFLVIIAFFILTMFQSDISMNYIAGINVLFTMMIITTISYDSLAKWDKYALTMPIIKKQMVLSKYISAIIFGLIGMALGIIIAIVSGIIKNDLNIMKLFISAIFSGFVMLVFISLTLPLVYKFGVEKFRIIIILIFMIPVIIFFILSHIMNLMEWINNWFIYILFSVPIISIAGFILSYFISVKIYENKEF